MKSLIINCSPVKTGATSAIVSIIEGELSKKYETKCICIDDYDFAFCKGCRSCMKIGCPAIRFTDKKASIDPTLCVGCGLCEQMCKFGAFEGGAAK